MNYDLACVLRGVLYSTEKDLSRLLLTNLSAYAEELTTLMTESFHLFEATT